MDGPLANDNNVIAFHDNSSAIKGFKTKALQVRPDHRESAR